METISRLLDGVRAAGAMALEAQKDRRKSARAYKDDASVLTEADRAVEEYLVGEVARHYPHANIIAEEGGGSYDPGQAYTFAIDPIDGTDVFSQGMPGWCVSVGLLDGALRPIAGIIYAPGWEWFLFADVGERATLNGVALPAPGGAEPLSARSNVMISSRVHQELYLGGYGGKIRSIGSAALHLCFPLVYAGVSAVVEGSGVHIWDIAGAHAINRAQGLDLAYLGGGPLDYAAMVGGERAGDVVLGGPEHCQEQLRRVLSRIGGQS